MSDGAAPVPALHARLRGSLVRMGAEQNVVLVVDDFLQRPEALIDEAAAASSFAPVQGDGYPGLRAPLPETYVHAVLHGLSAAIDRAFGLQDLRLVGAPAWFSLVTTRPEDLAPRQRIPHIDSAHPGDLAVLHYLNPVPRGGTSFYRHGATGWESIGPDRLPGYREQVAAALQAPPPPAYIGGSAAGYERVGGVEGLFNRLVVYRSMLLHSADIPAGFDHAPDPRRGRLTANVFLQYR